MFANVKNIPSVHLFLTKGGGSTITDYPVRVTFFNIIRLITRNSQLWNPALLCLNPADNHIFNNISVQL